MPRPGEDEVHQIPSLPGRKRRQMPGVCPGGCLSFDLTGTLKSYLYHAGLGVQDQKTSSTFYEIIRTMSSYLVDKSTKFAFTFCSLIHIVNKIVLKVRVLPIRRKIRV